MPNILDPVGTGGQVIFDNTTSGLTATTSQEAIDELDARIDTLEALPVQFSVVSKSFLENEEFTITLGGNVTSPSVDVTKEVPQVGVTTSRWNSGLGADQLEITDEAGAVTLTLGGLSGYVSISGFDFTNFVGYTIYTSDGGVLRISAVSTALVQTAPLTTTFTAGNWRLSKMMTFNGTTGITGLNTQPWDVSSAFRAEEFSDSGGGRGYYGGGISRNGQYLVTYDYESAELKMWTLSTPWDVASRSNTSNLVEAQINAQRFFLSDNGQYIYRTDFASSIEHAEMGTPWDISTKGAWTATSFATDHTNDVDNFFFNADGTELTVCGIHSISSNRRWRTYSLGTPWVPSSFNTTAVRTNDNLLERNGNFSYPLNFVISINGDYGIGTSGNIDGLTTPLFVVQFGTPFDVTTGTVTWGPSGSAPSNNPIVWGVNPDGSEFFTANTLGGYPWDVERWALSSSVSVTNEIIAGITNESGAIDTTYWTDLTGVVLNSDEALGELFVFFSTDGKTTISIITATGTRNIAKDNAGTWEINTNATYGLETWTPAATNERIAAIEEALGLAINQASSTDYTTNIGSLLVANSLHTGFAVRVTDSGHSTGITDLEYTYDANTLNELAIPGVDYRYDQPAADKIRIESLKAQNLKVRIS